MHSFLIKPLWEWIYAGALGVQIIQSDTKMQIVCSWAVSQIHLICRFLCLNLIFLCTFYVCALDTGYYNVKLSGLVGHRLCIWLYIKCRSVQQLTTLVTYGKLNLSSLCSHKRILELLQVRLDDDAAALQQMCLFVFCQWMIHLTHQSERGSCEKFGEEPNLGGELSRVRQLHRRPFGCFWHCRWHGVICFLSVVSFCHPSNRVAVPVCFLPRADM